MAMTYDQFRAFYKLPPTASSALAWFQSGQAPVGTPIPAALRAHFGGQAVLRPGTPNVDWPVEVTGHAVAPAPPPPMPTPPAVAANPTPLPGDPYLFPTPQNPFLPQMGLLAQQLLTMPQSYNPQRQAVAAGIASQLAQQGLMDFGQGGTDYTTQAATDPAGNITYGIVTGADGRAYVQAYSNTAHNFASRGVGSGTQVDDAQQEAKRALDIARQNLLTQNVTGQGSVFQSQLGAMGDLGKQWQDYATQGASEVAKTVAGWKVPETFSQSQEAARAIPQPTWQAGTATSAKAPQPSPLTQMTGGQRTITGGLASVTGGVNKTLGQVGSATSLTGKNVWDRARRMGTKSTRLAV